MASGKGELSAFLAGLQRELREGALRHVRLPREAFQLAAVQAELRELHRTGRPPERERVFAGAHAQLAEHAGALAALIAAAPESAARAGALALLSSGVSPNPGLKLIFFAQYDELLAERANSSD